jgi:hypothetical protein
MHQPVRLRNLAEKQTLCILVVILLSLFWGNTCDHITRCTLIFFCFFLRYNTAGRLISLVYVFMLSLSQYLHVLVALTFNNFLNMLLMCVLFLVPSYNFYFQLYWPSDIKLSFYNGNGAINHQLIQIVFKISISYVQVLNYLQRNCR